MSFIRIGSSISYKNNFVKKGLTILVANKNFYNSAFTLIPFSNNGTNGPTTKQKVYSNITGTTYENGEYSVCSFCTDHSTAMINLLVDGNSSTVARSPVTNNNGVTYD